MARPPITAAMCAYGRTVAEPRLSPDGQTLAFLSTAGGRAALVVVAAEGGPERVLTTEPPPLASRSYGGGAFDWLPDSRGLVYAGATGGLWLQAVAGGPPAAVVESGATAAPAVAPSGDRVAYTLDAGHVAVVALDGGSWPVRLSSTADFCFDPTWAGDSRRVAWQEWDVPAMPWDESRIATRSADGTGDVVVAFAQAGASAQQPRFSPDGALLSYLSDADGWCNLWQVSPSFDDNRPLVKDDAEHGGPSWGQGARTFAWSPDGRTVAYARNEDGFGALYLLDLAAGASSLLGRGVHGGLSWVGDRLAAVRSGARTPTEVVVYEGLPSGGAGSGATRRRTVAVGPVAGFEAAGLTEPEVVRWDGPDVGGSVGTEVPGRLYRPSAPPSGEQPPLGDPPPLIAWVHGGPTDQWQVGFLPRVAFWLSRGWAVLLVDHRGSTGHGRAFQDALRGRWGELDTADVVAGLRAAGERGWGDPERLVVMGGSAGGFTVLNVLAEAPDLCAAGVDLYGVADLFELDETTHRFEAHYLHGLMGALPEAAGRYRDRSPVERLDAIRAPLLVLQGSDDAVVPLAQSQVVVDRLRALGRTVELRVYEGEGHGWGRAETVLDEMDRTEAFLNRHVLQRRGAHR